MYPGVDMIKKIRSLHIIDCSVLPYAEHLPAVLNLLLICLKVINCTKTQAFKIVEIICYYKQVFWLFRALTLRHLSKLWTATLTIS